MPKEKKETKGQSKRKTRYTDNASTSLINEANMVWHSTGIDQCDVTNSTIGANVENGHGPLERRKKAGGNSRHRVLEDMNKDSGRGVSTSKDCIDDSRISPSPIVINPPSGHGFFSSVLQRCGYIIRQPHSYNEMYFDVLNFRKKLSDWLKENNDEMMRIENDTSKFLKALNGFLTDKENFILAMKPTKHETELIQPSLLHCLLNVEMIQPQLLQIVMPLLGEASLSNMEEDTALVSTILTQLKWLPVIVDGKTFGTSLLGVIPAATYTSQCQIIRMIPDILPSHIHAQVAAQLLEKFNDDALQLNVPLMDCFSSLDIPDGYWSNIRNAVIEQMASAPMRDLCAYFCFLFRAETVEALSHIIKTMRENVNLQPNDGDSKNDAHQVEILEKVGFSTTVNPTIVKIWLKQMKEQLHDSPGLMNSIDLIMALLFAESHKAATVILKLLFADKKLTVRLFSDMMKHQLPMIYHLFGTISKLLDSLLRSRVSKSLDTVCEITYLLFVGLGPLEAQVLMGNMSSILINFPPSRDTTLKILTKLADKNPNQLLMFAPYLMNVLDYAMHFPARQIRSLMNILAILSQTEGTNPKTSVNHFTAEFSILLRKQLTHYDKKIRCFGVFGSIATVRKMAEHEVPDEARMKELMKLAWNIVEKDEDACNILLDELSCSAEAIPDSIRVYFRDILKEKFQNLWTIDQGSEDQLRQYGLKYSLNLGLAYDANRECTQDRLAIAFENKPLQMSPLVVPAHLRVLAILESKVEEGNLDGIDALLGCPILIPKLEEYYYKHSLGEFSFNQRKHLGQYLVLAINYFRESICAFVDDANPELRVKLWLRLNNVLTLQRLLVRHFDEFPDLPIAYIADKTIGSSRDGAGSSGSNALKLAREARGKKPGPQKKTKPAKKPEKKKARRDVSESEFDDDNDEPVLLDRHKKVAKLNLEEDIYPKKIIPLLRRFDRRVFQLLLTLPLTCAEGSCVDFSRILLELSAVSQNPNMLKGVEKFNPETLALILTELKYQASDERLDFDILSIKNLLKLICTHINTVIANNEEEKEDFPISKEHEQKLESCLRLLISIIVSYLDAIKKLDKERKEIRVFKAFQVLARQVNFSGNEEDFSESDVMGNISTYLGGFVHMIQDPLTALDHMKLMKNLHDLSNGDSQIKKSIDETAKVYLKREWKLASSHLDGFLKIWFATTPSAVEVINHLVSELLTTTNQDEDSDDPQPLPNSSVYKSCTNANFHVWYTAMVSGLAQYAYQTLRKPGKFDDCIDLWIEAVEIFKRLVTITKEFPKQLMLVALLKHGRVFLEAFISGGAGYLPDYFKRNHKQASAFCHKVQVSCRRIQHICEHSKKITDMQLLKLVPLVKRVLETIVFRVREVLALSGATDAFWMGTLKHRNLQGENIPSQIFNELEVEFSSDDEEPIDDAPLSGGSNRNSSPIGVVEDSMDVDALNSDTDGAMSD